MWVVRVAICGGSKVFEFFRIKYFLVDALPGRIVVMPSRREGFVVDI